MSRFRVAKGRMLVVVPGEAPEWHEVRLVYDTLNAMHGIQLTGEGSPIRGWCFFVSEDHFLEAKEKGSSMDKIPPV